MGDYLHPPQTPPPSSPRRVNKEHTNVSFNFSTPVQSSPNCHPNGKWSASAEENLPSKKSSSRVLNFSLSQSKKKKKRRESSEVPTFWGLTTMTSPNFNPSRLTSRQQASLMSKCEALGRNIDAFTPEVLSTLSPFVLDRISNESSGIIPWTQQLNTTSPKRCSDISATESHAEKENLLSSTAKENPRFSRKVNQKIRSAATVENPSIKLSTKAQFKSKKDFVPTDGAKDKGTNSKQCQISLAKVEKNPKGSQSLNTDNFLRKIHMISPDSNHDFVQNAASTFLDVAKPTFNTDLIKDNKNNGPILESVFGTEPGKVCETPIANESHGFFSTNLSQLSDKPLANPSPILIETGSTSPVQNSFASEIVVPRCFLPSLPSTGTRFSKTYQDIIYKRAVCQIHKFISEDGTCCKDLLSKVKNCSSPSLALQCFLSSNDDLCLHTKKNELISFLTYLLV